MVCYFHKVPITPQKGYVFLLLMLILGSLGLFLNYQLSVRAIRTQAWEIQKTATEMGYWLDIERNYLQDNDTVIPSAISLTLLQQQYFLPYGLAEKNAFSLGTPVSEFLCSALPGISPEDGNLTLSGTSVTTTCNNPSCALNNLYYSCGITPTRAQYYTNTNYIDLSPTAVGLGLIVRAPKTTAQSLGDNSTARNLIALLPTSNANIYTTGSTTVNGIGIGSYILTTTGTTILANNSYNKIIDMGLVQTSKPGSPDKNCTGWNGGVKSGSGYLNGDKTGKSKFNYEPPTCIRITPGSHPNCKSFDVLYAMFRGHTDANSTNSGQVGYDIRDTVVRKNGSSFIDVYLTLDSENRGADSGYQVTRTDHKDSWLIYLVRCRQP